MPYSPADLREKNNFSNSSSGKVTTDVNTLSGEFIGINTTNKNIAIGDIAKKSGNIAAVNQVYIDLGYIVTPIYDTNEPPNITHYNYDWSG